MSLFTDVMLFPKEFTRTAMDYVGADGFLVRYDDRFSAFVLPCQGYLDEPVSKIVYPETVKAFSFITPIFWLVNPEDHLFSFVIIKDGEIVSRFYAGYEADMGAGEDPYKVADFKPDALALVGFADDVLCKLYGLFDNIRTVEHQAQVAAGFYDITDMWTVARFCYDKVCSYGSSEFDIVAAGEKAIRMAECEIEFVLS